MFDWLTTLPNVGWSTTVALMVVAAVGYWLFRVRKDAERKAEIHAAEEEYRKAVRSGDVDRIHLAARRLRFARVNK